MLIKGNKTKSTHVGGGAEGTEVTEGSFLKLAKVEANLSVLGELGKDYI